MRIKELFTPKKRVLSFELFPPKKDGDIEALFQTVNELKQLNPDYVSVTYGAGGSTRDMTYEIALRLQETGILPLVHFTCVGHSRLEIKQLLDQLRKAGIENLLALRGDPPRGQASFVPAPDGFGYASDLIKFIRSEGYGFCLGVAGYPEGHPEAKSKAEDIQNLKRKIQQGGDFVVTQLFFDNEDYFKYVRLLREAGVMAPVQPGIWLLTDYVQIERICSLSGVKCPQALKEKIEPIQNDKQKVARAGIEYAIDQCAQLLEEGAPGIHFYVMNKSHFVREVIAGLRDQGILF